MTLDDVIPAARWENRPVAQHFVKQSSISMPIAANTRLLSERAGSAGVMAVVKADAYGHGLIPSARAARAGGADWLGVALVDEGLALRAAGLDGPDPGLALWTGRAMGSGRFCRP